MFIDLIRSKDGVDKLFARELVTNLFALARVDGSVDESELQILTKFSEKLGLTKSDFGKLQNQAEADTTVRKIWIEWLKSGKPAIDRMMADAIARVDRNELQGALGVLDQVVQQAPHYAEGWNSRATVLYLLGSFEKSVADIGRTLALEPRHFGAMAGLGKILLQRGKLKEALGVYRRALVVNPFMVERDSVIPALEREVEGRGI